MFHPEFALPCVAPIGKDDFQSQVEVGKETEQDFGSVAVLHAGGRDDHSEQVSLGICKDMAFAAIDLFTRIVAAAGGGYRVGAFDALTVDDGDAGRSVFFNVRRTFSRRAVLMRGHRPEALQRVKAS